MPVDALRQRTLLDAAGPGALRLPPGDALEALHPGGNCVFVEDPRGTDRACLVGMMVLRRASEAWQPGDDARTLAASLGERAAWCYDVRGVGGSWPVSGGNAVDAFRLALQYGTMDAVLAGAATFAREGVVAGARRAHLWQPYTPLGWAPLAPHRAMLEPAIAALRRRWQELGVLSERRWPAQVAVSRSGEATGGELLDARAFTDRHPDGSPIEALVLTSEEGAERLRKRARLRGLRADSVLLVASPAGDPAAIDVAAVPTLLRRRLGVLLAEHDGGAVSLQAFLDAGAISQCNLTLMRSRSVRDVVEQSPRLDAAARTAVLADWAAAPRLFPANGTLGELGRVVQLVVEEGEGAEAVVATLDSRKGAEGGPGR